MRLLLEQGLTEVPAEGILILVFTVSEISRGNRTQSRSLPSRQWLTAVETVYSVDASTALTQL